MWADSFFTTEWARIEGLAKRGTNWLKKKEKKEEEERFNAEKTDLAKVLSSF